MATRLKTSLLCAGLLISVLQVTYLAAGETKPVSPAPTPAQISSAKKVFIANAGDEHVAHPVGEARILVIERKGSV